MPLNLQFGSAMSGVTGAVGLAAGQNEYALRKQKIESQSRQQGLQNAMSLMQLGNQMSSPYVNQAIRQQDKKFTTELAVKQSAARHKLVNSEQYIRTGVEGDAIRFAEGVRSWGNAMEKGVSYLKTIGPSDSGTLENSSLGSVKYGSGSGKLNPKQFEAAVNNLVRKSEGIGSLAMGSPRTQGEKFNDGVSVDKEGNRVWSSPDGSRIQQLDSRKDKDKAQFIDSLTSYQRMLDGAMVSAIRSTGSDTRSKLTALYGEPTTPEEVARMDRGVDAAISDLKRNFPKNPFGDVQQHFKDFMGQPPPTDDGGDDGGPLGGSPLGGGGGRTIPSPPPSALEGQDEVLDNLGGGGLPDMETGGGKGVDLSQFGAGGRTNQQVEAEAQQVGAAARAWRQELPRSASFWADPEQEQTLGRLSKMEFHAELDILGGMKPREWGLVGPEIKEKVGGWSGKPFHYERNELQYALSAIRHANDMEAQLPEGISLITAGGESANLHRIRNAAQSWIHDIQNQLDMSERTPPEKGYGGGKSKKWLYGGSPIPMPEILKGWKIAPARESASQHYQQVLQSRYGLYGSK